MDELMHWEVVPEKANQKRVNSKFKQENGASQTRKRQYPLTPEDIITIYGFTFQLMTDSALFDIGLEGAIVEPGLIRREVAERKALGSSKVCMHAPQGC